MKKYFSYLMIVASGIILSSCYSGKMLVDDDVYMVKGNDLPVGESLNDETTYAAFKQKKRDNDTVKSYYQDQSAVLYSRPYMSTNLFFGPGFYYPYQTPVYYYPGAMSYMYNPYHNYYYGNYGSYGTYYITYYTGLYYPMGGGYYGNYYNYSPYSYGYYNYYGGYYGMPYGYSNWYTPGYSGTNYNNGFNSTSSSSSAVNIYKGPRSSISGNTNASLRNPSHSVYKSSTVTSTSSANSSGNSQKVVNPNRIQSANPKERSQLNANVGTNSVANSSSSINHVNYSGNTPSRATTNPVTPRTNSNSYQPATQQSTNRPVYQPTQTRVSTPNQGSQRTSTPSSSPMPSNRSNGGFSAPRSNSVPSNGGGGRSSSPAPSHSPSPSGGRGH